MYSWCQVHVKNINALSLIRIHRKVFSDLKISIKENTIDVIQAFELGPVYVGQ